VATQKIPKQNVFLIKKRIGSPDTMNNFMTISDRNFTSRIQFSSNQSLTADSTEKKGHRVSLLVLRNVCLVYIPTSGN